MVFSCKSLGIFGMYCFGIDVEADLSRGLSTFDIVGLPDAAVKESRERVRSSMHNSGLQFPYSHITVNLAPADIKKEGPVYDLPILVAILKASGQINFSLDECAFAGELSLSGDLRPIYGVLPMALKAKELGIKKLFVPAQNACEGAAVEGIDVYPVKNIMQLYDFFNGAKNMVPSVFIRENAQADDFLDFSQVRGQFAAKRALEVAAAGGHNVIMIGPPGSGKSMLAKRLPSILPDMTFEEAIETTKLYSIARLIPENKSLITSRPFRSPHHTVSPAGLSGGGSIPRPGEISLAHNGVLFLDELPEFTRSAMEVLRQPLEDRKVTISRAFGALEYPCSIMLVAAMNPCPCGYHNHPNRECTCSQAAIKKYLSKISGPLLDRIDIHIEVAPVEYDSLTGKADAESSSSIKERVNRARMIQNERYKGTNIYCNANIPSKLMRDICAINYNAELILKHSFERFNLSARAYDRILKVARTIADLDGSDEINSEHICEAIQYRCLDKKY